MSLKPDWLVLLVPLLGVAMGFGALQSQVSEVKSDQVEIERTIKERSKYIADFSALRTEVAQHAEELKIMRPISIGLQKTLSSLDKTLAETRVEMKGLKEDISEIKAATVK
jgi:septation ring formation regulator EzrA